MKVMEAVKKMTRKRKNSIKYFLIIILLFLSGCSTTDSEAYNSAIQKGLDTLGIENYEKAQAYFELALEEKPDDTIATAYLEQTQLYSEAKKAFDTSDFETAKVKAEGVAKITEGSESLVMKAREILDKVKNSEVISLNIQKKYNEIISLNDAGELDDALEKTNALLDDSDINDSYVSDIKVNTENLQADIEAKKLELQNKEVNEAAESGPADSIEAYNELALPLKVLLATTTVDERAMSQELLGFTLYYNFDEDDLLVNINSGAGVGHPWFVIQYDMETITPAQGVVYTGATGYEDVSVESTPISKTDLYNRYIESKESYDLAIKNVVEEPEMTMSKYEELRSLITQ